MLGMTVAMAVMAVVIMWKHFELREQLLEDQNTELRRHELDEHVARTKEQVARQTVERALWMERNFLYYISQELRKSLADTGRLAFIIDRMMEMSRYARMREVMLKDRFLVNQTCHEVMDACQPKVNEGVELRFVTNLPDHYAVCTNRDCLKKVLELLLDNAARHTREGHITLLVMDSPDRKGCLLLSVTDTGEGIPEERQLTAFDLQPSGDREENLTGAGLYTCKLIIRRLGGIIYVDPHYEKGTRVIFEIKV